ATDTAGNNNTAATQLVRTADATVPTVALTSASPTTTNAPFLVTATFSESVTGFIDTDVTVANGTVSGFTGTGTTYNFTVTPNADGPVTVDIPAARATDTAGNNNTAATQLVRTADATVPTVALTSASPTTTNAPFLVTATFSESVTGFIASDVNLTNSTISNFTGSGTTYNFTVTPNADGPVTVDVPAATATDIGGNNNTAATQLTRTRDTVVPTVALTSASPTTVNAPFLATATFSESVTGFIASDVNLTNSTISNFTGSGTTYNFTVTPNADGPVTVDVPAATATDIGGNNNTAATQLTRTRDTVVPTVALTSASPTTVNAPFSVTATFSEDVTGFDNTDITVANATVGNFVTVDAKTYTFDVAPNADGPVTVDVPAATAIDIAGNNNTTATQLTRSNDATAPTVALTSASPTTTNAPFLVTATFSESVTGFIASDVNLTNSTISNFTGSGTTYNFTVTPNADGPVTVDVPAATATDIGGNNNTAATQLTRTNDATAPTVALTSASPTTINAPFLVTATFSESVTGFIASDVNLTNSTISNFTGSGTTYTFDVTPNADGPVTVDVPAAAATDIGGNNNTAATQLTRTADITVPTVVLTSTSPTTLNAPFSVTATFSEDVTGFDNTDINVANATVGNFVPVNATTYTFDVTPTGDGAVTVDVLAATATDTFGNNNTAAIPLTRTADLTALTAN
ncbi:Ig-like domain-containing protein, partial [Microcoleus sp. Pol8_D1]|uniref:Ig-like domain-containing protein n=1 Tax=Microcoleus sp. Pol8_D1 TaxID=2818898 RepID=UPI002FD68D26